jgi:hypothetical protein
MRDQGGSFALTSASFGGKRLGPSTALIDEDVLRVLLLDSPSGDKALQIRYDTIEGITATETAVTLACRDGRNLVVATADPEAFRQRMLAACRALPEVTRALRALGSRRGSRGTRRNPGDGEGRFFAPLIAARRRAMDVRDAQGVIAAFEVHRLAEGLDSTLQVFADELAAGYPARRRALEAELSDALEQLIAALDTLSVLATTAMADVDDLVHWRAWAAGVQSVFEAADRAWVDIERIVSR